MGKKIIILIIVIIIVGIVVVVLKSEPNDVTDLGKVKLSYNVGGCETEKAEEYKRSSGKEEKVDLGIGDGFIELTHYLSYVCCAKIKVYIASISNYPDYTLIKLKEKNEGEMCRCICDYEIDAKISPLGKGRHIIQIWGVEFEDMPAELLWEQEVEL